MRKSGVLVLLLFVFNNVPLYAQTISNGPEILILGTVHKNNKKITHHTLFDILNKVI